MYKNQSLIITINRGWVEIKFAGSNYIRNKMLNVSSKQSLTKTIFVDL